MGHKQPVWAVAFAPDSRTLASASADSTIKLWNITTQQELLSVRKTTAPASGLLFSPDGRLLVGWPNLWFGGEGELQVFRAPSLEDIDAALKTAPRKSATTRPATVSTPPPAAPLTAQLLL
jgi:WD40 repeat protein